MGIVTSFLAGLLLIYLGINGYLYWFQRQILYLPAHSLAEPRHYNMQNTEEIHIETSDGLSLKSWFKPADQSGYYLLYLHGNAGNLGDRVEKLEDLASTGWGLLAVSYRGYGGNPGSPSEEGLYNDARAAINFLLERGVTMDHIVIYGESLGSGVAIQMATEHPFKALILEAPYTSIINRAKELYPYIPIQWLIKDRFESFKKISSVTVPVLIFHGYRDDVMPIHHGRRMLMAANDPKEAHFFDPVGHTDFDMPLLASLMKKFVESH